MNEAKVLVLRSCDKDMKSYGGFTWPMSGMVEAPDWNPTPECGHGLHGLLWGEGDGSLMVWDEDAKWLVCRVLESDIVSLGGKVKFPRCEVIFVGDRFEAVKYIGENGAAGRAIVSGTATAGVSGTATAGDRGTATAGVRGTATAGYRGTATAGSGGVISIMRWNGKRYKAVIGHVRDEDGDGDLEPNVKYRLDENGKFVKAE